MTSKACHRLDIFDTYLRELRSKLQKGGTEHSYRSALEDLLKAISSHNKNIHILQEPKRDKRGLGSPDFRITEVESILGYVETKKRGEDLEALIDSDQIKKYRQLSPNILLTNYEDFIWLKGEHIQHASLAKTIKDYSNSNPLIEDQNVLTVQSLLQNFFSIPPQGITKAKDLAKALAPRSRILRDFFITELTHQEDSKRGFLYSLYEAFKEKVFKQFRIDEFANVFAQMIAYGLFLARLKSDESVPLTVDNAKNYIPRSFELIQQLTRFLDQLKDDEYAEIKWVVDEIFSIINTFDLEALHHDLAFSKKLTSAEKNKQVIEKDPYIHFYEDFLTEFDNDLRRNMGVYYTPLPIVHFIIQGVEDILKDTFDIAKGFADPKVTALDFATGTGTFLVEMFRHVLKSPHCTSGKRDLIIQSHLLKNFYGFEYMIAPYAIAHLKLSEFLKEEGYDLKSTERLCVYLTNTLESLDKSQFHLSLPGLDSLDHESEEAQKVKRKPILVIVGNPPYRGESRNKGEFITNLIKDYRFVDGEPLGERNPKWLQDDYVKFIRFAQHKMDQVEEGIVGVITNHSFLDNPTFRGMRSSLMKSFNQIYIVNLHGNSKKKERTPEGDKDENVFDIQQGVSISFFIKKEGIKRAVYYTDWWGKREDKFKTCLKENIRSMKKLSIIPQSPNYFFVEMNNKREKEYQTYTSVKEIFHINNVGIVTGDDKNLISIEKEGFTNVPEEEYIKSICYRPFDNRFINYDSRYVERQRENVMRHMLAGENVSLCISRQFGAVGVKHFDTVFITSHLVDFNLWTRGGSLAIPLYLYPSASTDGLLFSNKEKQENFKPEFRTWINTHYDFEYTPEEILGYIYGILHATTYRTRYLEFIKMDFPRIPFSKDRKVFDQLSSLGCELVQLHTLKKAPTLGLGNYSGQGDHRVEKIFYNEIEQKLFINSTQYFSDISNEIWEYHIGGYKVLDKYLKSRKKRILTIAEIENIEKVANIIAFTIQQMKKIDGIYEKIDQENWH